MNHAGIDNPPDAVADDRRGRASTAFGDVPAARLRPRPTKTVRPASAWSAPTLNDVDDSRLSEAPPHAVSVRVWGHQGRAGQTIFILLMTLIFVAGVSIAGLVLLGAA